MCSLECSAELLLETSRDRSAAARERTDNHSLTGVQIGKQFTCHVPKSTGHPMPLNGRPHGFGYHQADSGSINIALVPTDVDNEVRLGCPDSALDGGAEVGGPGHPILRGEQCR